MGHLTYSRELVTCVTNKHTGLAHRPISHSNTLDKPWSARSHWCIQTKREEILAVGVESSESEKERQKRTKE
jgi:hypothetical protein